MSERKGIGGHQSAAAGTTTWLTPPPIIAALGSAESFDLDPCAFPGWDTAQTGYVLPGAAALARMHRAMAEAEASEGNEDFDEEDASYHADVWITETEVRP